MGTGNLGCPLYPLPMSQAKRVIIYIRLSDYASGGLDPSTSPERQEEACRQYAAAHGWEVVAVVRDLDVSGSNKGLRLDRPGLREVRARWAEADVLLFAKIDRIARNVLDWSRLREEADDHSVALVSVAENLDLTTPSGRFVATILQAFAEMEAAMISTRTTEAMAYLAREGRYRGGIRPFGWTAEPLPTGGFRLALDPAQAPILRTAVDAVSSGGSVQAAATGMGWSPEALRALLRRPILRGFQVHHGEVVRGKDGLPIRPHEPLVTDAEWHALQAALDSRSVTMTPSQYADGHVLLRGIASCALCGARLHSASAAPPRLPSWVCSRRLPVPDGGKCPGVVVSRARLEEHVVAEVLDRFGGLEGTEVTLEERADDEVAEVEDALDAVLARLRVADDEEEEALMGQRRALRSRLKALQAAPVLREAAERRTGRTFAQDWEAADDEGRAALLASVLAVVSVAKGRRGPKGLDPSRLTMIFQPTPTAARGTVEPGVVYRAV